jgi:phage terminase small subunit
MDFSMKNSIPKAPKNLSREARDLWRKILVYYELDDSALLVLHGGLECFDRMRQAQVAIAKQGLTIVDRFGQMKQNPNLLTERDSKAGLLRHLKALNLDLEPLHDGPGRPGGH